MSRQPSWYLCRELAGAHHGGNVGDLADTIAQAIECSEETDPGNLPPTPPTLAEAVRAIGTIRKVMDKAEKRLRELAQPARGAP